MLTPDLSVFLQCSCASASCRAESFIPATAFRATVAHFGAVHVHLLPKNIGQCATPTDAMGNPTPYPSPPAAGRTLLQESDIAPTIRSWAIVNFVHPSYVPAPAVADFAMMLTINLEKLGPLHVPLSPKDISQFSTLTGAMVAWVCRRGFHEVRNDQAGREAYHAPSVIAKRLTGFMKIVENVVCTEGPEWTLGVGYLELARLALVPLENVGAVFCAKVECLWPEP
ncbi:hypothetical protein B0H21DRAFT_856189 [Amylocystis lapponica]|nr:hypothetical protein B0H21DRAFT_856189 [Amylocystis lapponica]